MGRHEARTDLGREFGATDVVAERGEEGIARVRELTGGAAHKVLEAVGTRQAVDDRPWASCAPAATISRLGVPQYEQGPIGSPAVLRNITPHRRRQPRPAPTSRNCCPTSSTAPSTPAGSSTGVRRSTGRPDAYRAMDDREVLKASSAPDTCPRPSEGRPAHADRHPQQRRRDADPRLRRLPDPRRADRAGRHRRARRRLPHARHRRRVRQRGSRRPRDRSQRHPARGAVRHHQAVDPGRPGRGQHPARVRDVAAASSAWTTSTCT